MIECNCLHSCHNPTVLEGRLPRVVVAFSYGAVVLPFLGVLLRAVTGDWVPSGDIALQVLQATDVGTSRSPLVGVYSRYGWNHPGPTAFYVAAPFSRAFGPIGMIVSTALVNAACGVVSLWILHRRAGRLALVVAAVFVLALCAVVGSFRLSSPWNPWALLFPALVALIVVWAVLDGSRWAVVGFVVAGSYALQHHLGLFPMLAAQGVVVVIVVAKSVRETGASPWVRPLQWAGGALVAIWFLPFVEQLVRPPGNVRLIIGSLRAPSEPPIGVRAAWRAASGEIASPGVLPSISSGMAPVVTLGVITMLALLVGLPRIRRRDDLRQPRNLAIVAFVGGAASLVGATRITGAAWEYLLAPFWVVTVIAWWSLVWAAAVGLRGRLATPGATGRLLVGLVSAVLLVVGATLAHRAATSRFDTEAVGAAVDAVASATAPQLDPSRSYVIIPADGRDFAGGMSGLLAGLERRGFDVAVPGPLSVMVDSWRVDDQQAPRDQLWIVGADDLLQGLELPDAELLAAHDQMTPVERHRMGRLWAEVIEIVGEESGLYPWYFDSEGGRNVAERLGVPAALSEELMTLRRDRYGYSVYLIRHSESLGS